MLKFIKECYKDFNEVQKTMNDMGLFTVYHHFGAFNQYIDNGKTTHINNTDDKQNTISTKDK